MSEFETQPGLHPETSLYHTEFMPPAQDEALAAIRDKQLQGEPLSIAESMNAGRDDTLQLYAKAGNVVGFGEKDEYEPGGNAGVDWYLGGAALKYGQVVIEAPADPQYFEPAHQNGHALAKDPKIRHMKSSGHANPVPFDQVRVVQG